MSNRIEQIEDWLRQADQLLAQLRQQVSATPVPEEHRTVKARLEELTGDILQREQELVALQESGGANPAYIYLGLARSHAKAENYSLALESYDKAIAAAAKQNNPLVLLFLERAEIYSDLGRWSNAITDYERVIQLSDTGRARLGLAIAFYHLGKLEQAEAVFQWVGNRRNRKNSGTDPRDQLVALDYLGAIAREQGNLEQALRYYWQILRLVDQLPERRQQARFYFNNADLLREMGDLPAAVVAYEQALERDPQNADIYQGLALVHLDQGEFSEAEDYLYRALELEPKGGHFLTNLGTVYMRQHDFQRARPLYRQALTVGWMDAPLYDGLGTCELADGNFEGAAAAFRQATRLEPESATSWGNLGAVLFRQKQMEEALEVYRTASKLSQASPVEKSWWLALEYLQNRQFEPVYEVLLEFKLSKDRQFYGQAEYEGAGFVAKTVFDSNDEAEFETVLREVKSAVNPLELFYWQNAQIMLELLRSRQ